MERMEEEARRLAEQWDWTGDVVEGTGYRFRGFTRDIEDTESALWGRSLYDALVQVDGMLESVNRRIEQLQVPRYLETELRIRERIEYEPIIPPEIQYIIQPSTYNIFVSFPNLIIREEADIDRISRRIDEVFMSHYYGMGGK